MIGEMEFIISGINFKKIDGKRILHSIFVLDIENSESGQMLISDDYDIDKGRLSKELLGCYRKTIRKVKLLYTLTKKRFVRGFRRAYFC